MPLPDPEQPATFAEGAPDVGQGITNRDVGPVKHYQGLLPGRRPYAWTCGNCGTGHMGFIEDGCNACGTGKNAKQGKPEPARDVICRACRGDKHVTVKCRQCTGSGEDPEDANLPCLDCGGSGTLVIECRRCKATGFDPEPRIVEQVREDEMADESRSSNPAAAGSLGAYSGMGGVLSERGVVDVASMKALPTLDDPPKESPPPSRYLLTEINSDGSVFVTEIAPSAKVWEIIRQAKARNR